MAHRLSAPKRYNQVAVVENHTVTDIGSHETIRKKNAYYNAAWTDYEAARNVLYQVKGGKTYEK